MHMRVLLADDQSDVRSALQLLLKHETEFNVVGEAIDYEGLLTQLETTCPDLVLIDWELPGLNTGLLPSLRLHSPHLFVIALSGRPEARQAALSAGANAFVSKGDPPERLLRALRALFPTE